MRQRQTDKRRRGKRGGRKEGEEGEGGEKRGGQTDRQTDTCSVHMVITWCIVVWCAYGNYLVNSCMVCIR